MKASVTYLFVLLIVASEVTLWVRNPMHIPAAFIPARACGLQLFQELDSSMKPTISPGHYVLVSAWPYWKREPQAGDVIAFLYPPDPLLADVKRIIAVGGSTVEIRNGITYVDRRPDPGSHLQRYLGPTVDGRNMPVMRVPLGSYFVMGDDSDLSEDSRTYGVIPRGHIIGEAVWPERLRADPPTHVR
jgi:signal peptidase I